MSEKVSFNADKLIDSLSSEDKIILFENLQRRTRNDRWSKLLDNIDKRVKGKPISQKEIAEEVKAVRKQLRD